METLHSHSVVLCKSRVWVAMLDINKAAGENLKEEMDKQYDWDKTVFLVCDVESDEQFKAAFQKATDTFGGIDILCNNAGILNEAEWEKTISVNLMGVIRGTYLAMEQMNKQSGGQGGVIINTSSLAGLQTFPSFPVYTATKHAVVGFTRAMAAASVLSGYGVRLNALCPAFVHTNLTSDIQSKLGQFSHLMDGTQQLVDKYGITSVSQVAECLLELLTDETKNGEALMVFKTGKTYATFPSI
ncbi:15-hydroxyprostaglandin dehydrogenase [NAD(+)]-like isoform X2 [Gouania willdenowi]|uniref:15-hydroxyprostaglandin dehydrogenase [NAD(+)]-like isoform X2 n=1 Tax=Gouania willdenowi TaxID=441366 RepID=UPI001055D74E|nr:15-hydroxyprostaglandin dehydrogenase [NAD(+)]-like isoform X2 [Gouania willdenowi]XP_028322755.1 15-hydroxyprostaglandin dehydrogenase [NAD(+)]-like isoform X2 [Gouania willdenowi]